ncbi:MAG: hypothetical protein H6Q33_2868 [Deltaproteobacteria bacterium]|jgi:hypothetical protein|nr:hypothetical protein [Deltaproteobacteria bacterium]
MQLKQLTVHGLLLDYVHSAETPEEEQARAQRIGRAANQISHATTAVVCVDNLLMFWFLRLASGDATESS